MIAAEDQRRVSDSSAGTVSLAWHGMVFGAELTWTIYSCFKAY
jgi:hypothetical protein